MGNLVPERRMNKNGAMVTKHVRADGPACPAASPAPPPVVLSSRVRQALRGLGGGAATRVAAMTPELRARFEAMIERRAAFTGIVGTPHRFDDFIGDVLAEKDPAVRAAAIGIVAAVDDDALEWVVNVEICRGLSAVPELAEHLGDLSAAPKSVLAGARNLARYIDWLYANANSDSVIIDRRATRIADRELEELVLGDDTLMDALSNWAYTDPRALAGPEAMKFFCRRPDDRTELGMLLDLYVQTDHGLSQLTVENWDRREEIIDLIDNGVKSAEAIRKVLEGEVPGAIASGTL